MRPLMTTSALIACLAALLVGQSPPPVVLFDEGHNNFHTSAGSYRTYSELLRADGFEVRPLRGVVSPDALAGVTIFLSANPFPEPRDTLAQKAKQSGEPFRWSTAALRSAYSPEEVNAVRRWITGGGAMLLILDHAPHGSTAGTLAKAVGVDPRDVETTDPAHQEAEAPMAMLFTGDMIGQHPITSGVKTVATFLGQSLGVPRGASALLRLADAAVDREWVRDTKSFRQVPAGGRAQAVALEHGKGRVVVLGEAGMLGDAPEGVGPEGSAGINRNGVDNRRFGLNIARWLARRAD